MDLVGRIRGKLTYPNIGVTLCLLLAITLLGAGQAYAINTIRGEDVVDESLTGRDVANETLTEQDLRADSVKWSELAYNQVVSLHVVDGTLQGHDVKDKSLTDADIDYGLHVVADSNIRVNAKTVDTEFVNCPSGTSPLGGGARHSLGLLLRLIESYPVSSGWVVAVENTSSSARFYDAYVTCAKLGPVTQVSG